MGLAQVLFFVLAGATSLLMEVGGTVILALTGIVVATVANHQHQFLLIVLPYISTASVVDQ